MTNNKIHVKDEHRKNELSLIPGGATVKVVNDRGLELAYDKIKNPEAYIKKARLDPSIVEIWVNGELYWKKG